MVYPNNSDPRRSDVHRTNFTPWIIGGALALALVIGSMFMMGDRNINSTTASGTNSGAATTTANRSATPATPNATPPAPASTTGSGAAR